MSIQFQKSPLAEFMEFNFAQNEENRQNDDLFVLKTKSDVQAGSVRTKKMSVLLLECLSRNKKAIRGSSCIISSCSISQETGQKQSLTCRFEKCRLVCTERVLIHSCKDILLRTWKVGVMSLHLK